MKFHGTLIISLMILIYVIRNGGSDHDCLQNALTFILKGIVKGVFGWPAIHTRKGEKEEPLKSVICSLT
jgi:hypothetical protein